MKIEEAAKFAFKNKNNIQLSKKAGCYYCLKIFGTEEIKEYTDNNQTAICPFCNVDSVIAIDNLEFLIKCKNYWFNNK